jgi:hypothetical protein
MTTKSIETLVYNNKELSLELLAKSLPHHNAAQNHSKKRVNTFFENVESCDV